MINLVVHYVVLNNANWVVPCWFYHYFWSLLYALSTPFLTSPISPCCCSYAPHSVLFYRQVFMLGLFIYFFSKRCSLPWIQTCQLAERFSPSSCPASTTISCQSPFKLFVLIGMSQTRFSCCCCYYYCCHWSYYYLFFYYFFKFPSTGSSSLICLFYCYLL